MNRRQHLVFAVLLCLILCSCARASSRNEGQALQVWYLDKSATVMTPVPYTPENTDPEKLVAELLQQLIHVPNDAGVLPPAGEKTEYLGFRQEEGVLNVLFDERYAELKPERKMLACAAITRTLTQVSGVSRVGFYAGEQPLQTPDGAPLGPFSDNDFVSSISNINRYETEELTLYFADETGTYLSGEQRTVTYRVETPLEQIVMEQLISGPALPGRQAVLPPDVKVLSVSVNENICYLNLSREFLAAVPLENPELTIYAIVNTLSELKAVQHVQIAVEGSKNLNYRDRVSLEPLFERNLDYLDPVRH